MVVTKLLLLLPVVVGGADVVRVPVIVVLFVAVAVLLFRLVR